MPVGNKHFVHARPIRTPFIEADSDIKLEQIQLALGCFWGAERKFWSTEGVYTTAVGYAGGTTENPSYKEVCIGTSGHAEVVIVVFEPEKIALKELLQIFFESHDPTQGMRQGNDIGSQYRSGIYYYNQQQKDCAEQIKAGYQQALSKQGFSAITTEILPASEFYYAEDYHQQYLAKNPDGYCGLGGTGISCAM